MSTKKYNEKGINRGLATSYSRRNGIPNSQNGVSEASNDYSREVLEDMVELSLRRMQLQNRSTLNQNDLKKSVKLLGFNLV